MSLEIKCHQNLNVPKYKMLHEPNLKKKEIGTDCLGLVDFSSLHKTLTLGPRARPKLKLEHVGDSMSKVLEKRSSSKSGFFLTKWER